MTDVKIIVPLEVHNAVVGVYMHVLSAFTGPPRAATRSNKKISDLVPLETHQEKRQEQHRLGLGCSVFQLLYFRPEDEATDNEFLGILKQNEQVGLVPEALRVSSIDDTQKIDPLPESKIP